MLGGNYVIPWDKVMEAVGMIHGGVAKRVDIPNVNITVYSCGTIIRIDIRDIK